MAKRSIHLPIPKELLGPVDWICQQVALAGGVTYIVGGAVRDGLFGIPIKDIDLEVFRIEPTVLEKILKERFTFSCVGRQFCVYKLHKLDIDVSIPRTESKIGLGHTAFEVIGNPALSFQEAACRRDFTINAMGWNPLSKELQDPFGGESDLANRRLHHVGPQFIEDPLRVLRGMQFCGRFSLKATPETLNICRKMTLEGLSAERIYEEWIKWITKSEKPSLGLTFLHDSGWLRYYPELEALYGCPQDPLWHPEGDVWSHTLHCLDDFAKERTSDPWEDLVVGFAVLTHDFGKPKTTIRSPDGHIRSPKHDTLGVPLAKAFLERFTQNKALIEEVLPLVECHMRPGELYKNQSGAQAIRRLAHKVKRVDRLLRVVSADLGGRPPIKKEEAIAQALEWFNVRTQGLGLFDKPPTPILLGRHLIEKGLKPGPHFKSVLNACFEAQLDGHFHTLEEAKDFLEHYLASGESTFSLEK